MSKNIPYQTTLEVRDTCLCLHAQRAARALARQFDEALRPVGLTNGQFSLLMALNRPEAPTIGAAAQTLAMDRTTLTAALKPLVREALVTVAVSKADRRSRVLQLTPQGHEALLAALPIWRQVHQAVEGRLPQGGAAGLRAGLQAFSISPDAE